MTSEVDIYRSRHTGKEIDDAVDRVAQLINELDSLGGSWVEVVQTTGFSTSKVMSQAAVTRLLDTLAKLYDPKQGITAEVLKAVKTFMLENQDNGQENAILYVKNTDGGSRELRVTVGGDTLIIPLKSGHVPLAEEVQPLLVSGRNIKAVNGVSLLGGGNIKTGSSPVVAGIVNADVIAEKGIGESHTLQSAISTIPESLRRTGVCVRFADAGIESYSLEIYSKPIADGWKWKIELDGKNAEITLNQSMTIKDVADAAMAVAGTFSDWTFTREAEGKIRIDRKFEGRCIPPFISNGCGFRLRYISVGTSREERTFQYTGKDSSSIGDTALWRDVSKSPINLNDLTRLFSFNLRYGHV